MSRERFIGRGRAFTGAAARPALLGVGGAVLLLGLGTVLALTVGERGGAPGPGGQQPGFASEDLERERREREILAGEVEELRARLDLVESRLASSHAGIPPQSGSAVDGTGSSYDKDDTLKRQPAAFDSERLVRSGADDEEAERLRALWSEIELEKLYVIDQAEREGWSSARRYGELRRLQESVRQRLDDEAYDRYLYAVQTPNRVVIRDVIDGSPAQKAGIRPGDVVLSYGGRRVFGRRELREATSFGEEDELVRLEIVREGRSENLTVPGGPIGLLLMSQLHEPR